MRNDESNNPFVGPVPCSEVHAKNFYGRTAELRDLIQKVRIQDLTIITAESGAGKTSLINAGLIPALRYWREGDIASMGFALYVGTWGSIAQQSDTAGGGLSIGDSANIFREAVTTALEELGKLVRENSDLVGIKQLKKDLDALDPVLSLYKDETLHTDQATLLGQYIEDIKTALPENKLILIVDQAEEFMGSGVSAGRAFLTEALSTLASLIKTSDVKVIISLREEYMSKLRQLENMYLPLGPRIFHLYPLTWDNAIKALVNVASSSGRFKIGIAEMDTVLTWANSFTHHDGIDKNTATVEMLTAQAFLTDIYDRAYDSLQSQGLADDECQIVIDKDHLDKYLHALYEAEPRLNGQDKDLYIGALLRWIDRAFNGLGEDGPLIRRVAANMGSVLATPRGYKSHITRGNLIFHAIREELTMCLKGGSKKGKKAEKQEIAKMLDNIRRLLKENKPLTSDDGYNDLTIKLWAAACTAVDQLADKNILKNCGQDEFQSSILSLQHDGYASALTEWCTDPRRREDDVLVPDIGVYGKQIIRMNHIRKQDLERLRWDGCFVDGLTITDVHFRKCSFDASFITKCTFKNCIFTDCKINGAFILKGSFKHVKFDHCAMLGTVIRGTRWDDVAFIDCNLSSAVIRGVRLKNALHFNKSKAHYAQLYTFKPAGGQANQQISAHKFDIYGSLFQDFDEKDRERFDCLHWTEFTRIAPPQEKKSARKTAF
ncbi:pentapeptide repeat-containing protein [Fundidesulfovibrio agrisoli]|uniref:nSTAND1 domain-containing NTPase n=1 Tax=Fundidesulfovibrio agrisoli TaxID=2922717 RepID=UPI001FACF13F|nr:pentapeptide repeat-containing protein [Fundidesulfovibrio agrisoli]